MKDQLMASGADFKGFGIQVNDGGTASFFAVVKKSQDAQAERIEKNREAKRTAHKAEVKKAAEKRAEKKKAEKREAEKLKEEKAEAGKQDDVREMTQDEIATYKPRFDAALRKIWEKETETISAGSVEELIQKVGDYVQNEKMNSVTTPEEALVGQHIDFKG
jgi:DNA-directed RNA polymerase subunit F